MQPRQELVEPEAIKYAIHLYQQSRSETAPPQRIYNGISIGVSYVAEAIHNTFIKPVESNKIDKREKLCNEFITLADNITPENIVKSLVRIGEEADAIQRKELKRFAINQKISDFTQCAHFIRQLQLYRILRVQDKSSKLGQENEAILLKKDSKDPNRQTSLEKQDLNRSSTLEKKELNESTALEKKELYVFSKKILEEQETLKTNLAEKLKELYKAQDPEHSLEDDILIINKKVNELRCKLAYLGDTTALKDFDIRQALYPSKFYSIDPLEPKRPRPAFPYIFHKNFASMYIKRIYTQQGILEQLYGKDDDQIITHFEEYARKQMEHIYKKQEELKTAKQEELEAKKKVDVATAKLSEQPSPLSSFMARFYPSVSTPGHETSEALHIDIKNKNSPIMDRQLSDTNLMGNKTPKKIESLPLSKKNKSSESVDNQFSSLVSPLTVGEMKNF